MNDIGIDAATPAVTAPQPRALRARPGAQLVPTRGHQTGVGIAVAHNRITIGRARDCDILLEDATISRHHAELHHDENDHYTLVDTDSLNGIYLNRHPMTQQVELVDGDEIWIGKARFAFHLPSRPPHTTSH